MSEASQGATGLGVSVPAPVHSPWPRAHPGPPPSIAIPGHGNNSSNLTTLPGSSSSHTRKLSFGTWSTHKNIKYGRGKYADVELMPQPSDDADDPLNWPRWRKDLNLAALLSVVGLVGAMKTVFLTTNAVAAAHYRTSLVVCGGSSLALVGILSLGLGVSNFMGGPPPPSPASHPDDALFSPDGARQLSFALVSFQLAILAAGTTVLDAATRPSLARSASFTSSNMVIALRSIGDMHTGVIVLRNLAAGVFVLAIPVAVAHPGGLKAVALGLGVAQIVISAVIVTARCYFDESIWRADGKVMGLVDLSSLKRSASFFETD
ncbi:hypothetical protein CCM_00879 [Cordyceps militaris CM01]|uniref:Uncharacterized protein n=1 Tax=Cordyceps militaris (strain CM01) TaxID=983644 RepID=G3J6U7_CORMM|nr:uncharacterized protein CCM_00879 [Cordyceps militaris CM01]EGX96224.1 hypothetical protein CCM_00879 [Cordyceps militaris CM01]